MNGQPLLGVRLRRLRVAKGLTQREVAAPEYSHAYISTIESGRRHPSPTALRHFAGRLGVDVEEITSGRPPGLVTELERALHEARVAASDGRLEDAGEALDRIARRARRYGLNRARAGTHEIRGVMLERSGRPEDALEEYERAERLLQDEPPARQIGALSGKARCLQALGDCRYAIFLLEALERRIAADGPDGADVSALAHIRSALLDAYLDAGLLRAAEQAANDLERLVPRLHDPVRLGQAHLYVARLRTTQGRARDADRMLAAAAEAYEAAGLRTETGCTHLARGYLLSREGKLASAERELQRARRIFEQTRDEKEISNTLIELGRVERVRGRLQDAETLLAQAMERLQNGDTQMLAWAHREYGLLHAERDHPRSEKHLRIAAELFDRADEQVEAAATHRMLGDVLRADGQEDAAFEAYSAGMHCLPANQ